MLGLTPGRSVSNSAVFLALGRTEQAMTLGWPVLRACRLENGMMRQIVKRILPEHVKRGLGRAFARLQHPELPAIGHRAQHTLLQEPA